MRWPRGGLLVFNAFLGRDGYEPDRLARELGHTSFASVFSHEDLAFVVDELPFEQLSDESAFEFEKANSTPSAWPPTECSKVGPEVPTSSTCRWARPPSSYVGWCIDESENSGSGRP